MVAAWALGCQPTMLALPSAILAADAALYFRNDLRFIFSSCIWFLFFN
jgi:hypothetical protein